MGHSILFGEATDLCDALLGTTDDEAVGHEPLQVGRDRRVDERVAPPAGILFAIRDHDVLFGELPSLSVGLGDDQIPRQRPLRDRLAPACRLPVVQEALLAREQALEVGGGPGDPVVRQRRRAPERDVTPAADPERWTRPGHALALASPLDRVADAL